MRRVLIALLTLLLVAAAGAGVWGLTTLRVGPDLETAELPGPRLRVHPHAAGPGAVLTCTPATPGAPVRWTVDGVPAGDGATLVAPPTLGSLVVCESGEGDDTERDRVVVGPYAPKPNLLLVILDDVGVDKLAPYQPLTPPPPLPTLDALAAEGVRFATAWTNPICSPTRAGLLTGLHATNHGVGRVIDGATQKGLLPGVRTIATLLKERGYATAAVGKWHITGEPAGIDAVHALGFDNFRGTWGNLHAPLTRYRWPLLDDSGRETPQTRYSDDVLVELAGKWIGRQRGPWFLWMAFHGAHAPWNPPPADATVPSIAANAPFPDLYDSVLRATDRALGRLLDGLPPEVRANTTVVVIGDNGTADRGVRLPYTDDRAKGTLYDLGVHVPLIVVGPGVPETSRGQVATGLVSHVDVLPTLLELSGEELPDDVADALDGVSFRDLLVRPDLPARRDVLYAETFEPHDRSPPWRYMWTRSVRDERYQLVAAYGQPDELYDLAEDPLSRHDLLAGTPKKKHVEIAARLSARMSELMRPKAPEVIRPQGVIETEAGEQRGPKRRRG